MFTPSTITVPVLVLTLVIFPTVPLSLPAITCGQVEARQRWRPRSGLSMLRGVKAVARPPACALSSLHALRFHLLEMCHHVRTLTVSPAFTCIGIRTGLWLAVSS